MKYYNSNHELVEFEYSKSHHHGGCSHIYLIDDDIALKKYYDYTTGVIKSEIFSSLKKIQEPNFVKLIECFYKYDENLLEITEEARIDAYTYQYINSFKINFLEDKDYLLFNIKMLEKLFAIFTELKIKTADCKAENTVLTKEYIVFIDPDMFKFEKTYDLTITNKRRLLNLIQSLLIYYTRNMFSINDGKIYDLTSLSIYKNTSIADELTKKLTYYKRPIDYLK